MRHTRVQAILIHNNEVLFLKQFNYKNQEEYWMYPGGNLEKNEDYHDAIVRELAEECNIYVKNLQLIDNRESNGTDVYSNYVTFMKVLKHKPELIKGNESVSYRKIIGFEWLNLNKNTQNSLALHKQIQPSLIELKYLIKENMEKQNDTEI